MVDIAPPEMNEGAYCAKKRRIAFEPFSLRAGHAGSPDANRGHGLATGYVDCTGMEPDSLAGGDTTGPIDSGRCDACLMHFPSKNMQIKYFSI
jgi:hypothetical protein